MVTKLVAVACLLGAVLGCASAPPAEPRAVLPAEELAFQQGLGIYQAERAFPAAEVGPSGREYRVRFTFVDPA